MSSSASSSLRTGELLLEARRLGRYEIVAKLASGGMATVYIGRATGVGGFERLVAIKCCHPHLRDDPEFRTMFLDEARLAAFIHHPNVVSTLDVQDADELFLVMEYVEGGRLSELVRAARDLDTHLPVDVIVRVFGDALQGLHAAHVQTGPDGAPLNLIHRDISPQNILVGVDGGTRVVDFGVAKAEARATVTTDQQLKGKLAYMAPEQLGNTGLSQRSDLFAAGVVLWEALTGARLFEGDSRSDVAQRILYLPIRRPSTRREGIAPELESIVMRALARAPEERFPTALDMAAALESCGVAPASQRRVGECVQELLGQRIDARRELLRDARRSARPVELGAEPADGEATSGVVAAPAREDAPGGRRGRRGGLLALAAVALLAVGALVAWWAGHDPQQAPAPTAAPAPTSAPARAPAPAAPENDEELEHPRELSDDPAAPARRDVDVDVGAEADPEAADPDPTVEPERRVDPAPPRRRRRPRAPRRPVEMREYRPEQI